MEVLNFKHIFNEYCDFVSTVKPIEVKKSNLKPIKDSRTYYNPQLVSKEQLDIITYVLSLFYKSVDISKIDCTDIRHNYITYNYSKLYFQNVKRFTYVDIERKLHVYDDNFICFTSKGIMFCINGNTKYLSDDDLKFVFETLYKIDIESAYNYYRCENPKYDINTYNNYLLVRPLQIVRNICGDLYEYDIDSHREFKGGKPEIINDYAIQYYNDVITAYKDYKLTIIANNHITLLHPKDEICKIISHPLLDKIKDDAYKLYYEKIDDMEKIYERYHNSSFVFSLNFDLYPIPISEKYLLTPTREADKYTLIYKTIDYLLYNTNVSIITLNGNLYKITFQQYLENTIINTNTVYYRGNRKVFEFNIDQYGNTLAKTPITMEVDEVDDIEIKRKKSSQLLPEINKDDDKVLVKTKSVTTTRYNEPIMGYKVCNLLGYNVIVTLSIIDRLIDTQDNTKYRANGVTVIDMFVPQPGNCEKCGINTYLYEDGFKCSNHSTKPTCLPLYRVKKCYSNHDADFEYTRGDIVPNGEFQVRRVNCGAGIHFCMELQTLFNYNNIQINDITNAREELNEYIIFGIHTKVAIKTFY